MGAIGAPRTEEMMDIGKLGVWSLLEPMPADEAVRFVQQIEKLGYPTLWLPEAFGREPFASIGF